MNTIIAVCGFKRSGKDTVSDILVNDINTIHGITPVKFSFATNVRKCVEDIFNIREEDIEDKESLIDSTKHFFKRKMSYRDLLVTIGEGMKKIAFENVWVTSVENIIIDDSRTHNNNNNIYVLSDVRYKAEMDMLKRFEHRGFKVIRVLILRKSALPEWVTLGLSPFNKMEYDIIRKDFKPDRSELEWCTNNPKFHFVLTNDGTIEELRSQVQKKMLTTLFA